VTPDQFQRLSELFEQARAIAPGERHEFLDRHCGRDGELRAKLDELLAEHQQAGTGMGISSPEVARCAAALTPMEAPAGRTRLASLEIQPGDLLDEKYKVLEVLGEGGLGVVYLAEQTQPVRRRVALKVVKLGMDTRQILGRFEVERNSLTLMDHPGIARLYDAGITDRGRPYFVMEYIQGVPITEFANHERLDTRHRLELFLPVCAAVQHAHQKGIIHRDLKPSNILVALQDGRPAPRIIDFGIAKATYQKLTDHTMYTERGQLIGTPEYMSPEQAEMSGLGIDSTTDIYSLGVVLYELLTGVLPFDSQALRTKGVHELQRLIRDEEPPKPSTRVSTLGDTTQLVVKHRRTEPRLLWRELKGDLDWIIMKAMEKLRTRRYASASELAGDIQRHLDCLPVLAGPPGAFYKLGKFTRRNRALVVSTCVVALALLGGAFGATWGMMQSWAQRDRAVDALKETEVARDAAKTAQASAIAERRKAEAALERAEVNVYYSGIAQSELNFRLQDLAKSELSLERCVPGPGQVDRRGWEWHYLKGLQNAAVLSPPAHEKVVYAVAFGQTGSLLASGGGVPAFFQFSGHEPGELKVTDARDGRLLHDLAGRTVPVVGLAFSSAGDHLAVAAANVKHGASPSLQLWDLGRGEPAADLTLDPEARWASSLAFDPGGRRLAAYVGTGVALWDLATSERTMVLPGQMVLLFGSDGERLLTYGRDGSVTLWHAGTGEPIRRSTGFPAQPARVVFSPDEQKVAVVGEDRRVVLVLECATSRLLHTLRSHPEEVSGLAFSPDGRLLATCGSGSTVRLWNVEREEERYRFLGHTNRLECVAFSPEGARLASGGWDGRVKVWDLTRHPEYVSLVSCAGRSIGRIEAMAIRDDGRAITVHVDGTVRTWDCRTGLALAHRWLQNPCALAVPSRRWALTPDGARLFAVLDDSLRLGAWDVDAGRRLATFVGHTLPVFAVASSRDGRRAASAAWSSMQDERILRSEIKVWNAADGRGVFTREAPRERISGLALSPAGDWLLAAGMRQGSEPAEESVFVLLWEVAARREVEISTPHETWIEAAAFAADGGQWATGDRRGRVVVRRLDAAPPQASTSGGRLVLEGPPGIADLAFSPDGRRLAVVNREVVTVWDTATGHEVVTLRGRPRKGTDPMFNPRLAFSGDGLRIAASQWDESVSIWSAEARGGPASARLPSAEAVFAWHIREARESLADGNVAAAEAHLRSVAGTEPPSLDLRLDRGSIFAQAGWWERAIDDYSAALLADPRDVLVHELRGEVYVHQGNLRAAAADFARAAASDVPKSLESWIGHTLLSLETGDLESRRRALPRLDDGLAGAGFENSVLGHLVLAVASEPSDVPSERVKELEELRMRHPESELLRLATAAAALRAGELEIAARCCRGANPQGGGDGVSSVLRCLILAMAEHRLGNAEAAGEALARARSWRGQATMPAGTDWRLWLVSRALFRESETLIK
jgi:WD40 repeat protein/serine/threonine protein kinase